MLIKYFKVNNESPYIQANKHKKIPGRLAGWLVVAQKSSSLEMCQKILKSRSNFCTSGNGDICIHYMTDC